MAAVRIQFPTFQKYEQFTDEELVQRILSGDTFLFEMIMRRYNQRLFRTIMGILRDEGEAEDVMQEAYVRAYTHLSQFSGKSKFSTWLTKIAIHECFARIRRRKRMTRFGENALAESNQELRDPAKDYLHNQMIELIQKSASALPPRYRVVFMMRDVQGLSTPETAECLSLSEEVVKTRLHRARALIRKSIQARAGLTFKDVYLFAGKRCDRIVAAVMKRISV